MRKAALLKILHVIATADPRSGGPIEGIVRSSAVLAKLGHSREIVTFDHPSDPWVMNFPVKVFPLGHLTDERRKRWNWLPWVHYGYTPKMVLWLKAHAAEYDVVIVNGLWNYSGAAVRKALASSEVPYFVFTHGMLDPWFRRQYPIKTILKQISWWFNEGPLLAKARGVLFTTDEERVLARGAFWPYRLEEVVVGYGTDDISGDSNAQIAAFRKRIPALEDRKFLLFLSRSTPKKDATCSSTRLQKSQLAIRALIW